MNKRMKDYGNSYKQAGVDVNAGYKAVELIKQHAKRTFNSGVVSDIGGFGGLFKPDFSGMDEPILVSSTDGVGTKLKIAFVLDKHDTIGIDCVAMCTNDIICCGAKPMFFLDYMAVGKAVPEKIAKIVSGVAEGCVQAGCALIGGETAEHPQLMPEDEYDIAGFCVGVVDRKKMFDNSTVKAGDAVIALESSGVHSNGFSLIRQIFGTEEGLLNWHYDELGGTLGEALLIPTRIYVNPILDLASKVTVKGASNITGGGFFENIPRILPEGLSVKVDLSSLQIPPIFNLIQKVGNIPQVDMFGTYNMGVGMCLIVGCEQADEAVKILVEAEENAYIMGEVVEGGEGVILC